MTNYHAIPGFSGSEIERATMVAGIFPTESALEKFIKQKVARGLTRLANYLDPVRSPDFKIGAWEERCC